MLSIKKQKDIYQTLDGMINNLKPRIFWKEKSLVKKQLTAWRVDELKNTIYEINNIEILCKKNPRLSGIILFNFLTRLCKDVSY